MATMPPHAPGTSAWVCRKCQGLPESSGESPSSPRDGGRHHCDSALIILNEDFLPFFPTKDIFSGLWNYCSLTRKNNGSILSSLKKAVKFI